MGAENGSCKATIGLRNLCGLAALRREARRQSPIPVDGLDDVSASPPNLRRDYRRGVNLIVAHAITPGQAH